MTAMALAVNHTGANQSTVTTYTLSTRPAANAANMPHRVIYVSDLNGGTHQVSDGTQWLNLDVAAIRSPRACDTFTLATRPDAATAGEGKFIYVSNLSGGTYQRSDGTNWQSLGTNIYDALVAAIGVHGSLDDIPQRAYLTRYTPASTVFIDPLAGNDSNNGSTPALARLTLPSTLVAGTAYLFRSGRTVSGSITVGQSGTAGNEIVIGVYDPITGARVTSRETGLVTVTGGIVLNNRNYVAVEHLYPQSNNRRIEANSTDHVQIICCRTNGGQTGIYSYTQDYLHIDGCLVTGATDTGILIERAGGTTTNNLLIQHCTVNDNRTGIVVAGDTTVYADCHIDNNRLERNRGVDGLNNTKTQIRCFCILTSGSTIDGNICREGRYSSINVNGDFAVSATYDFSIKHNDIRHSGFGIHINGKIKATQDAPIIIEYNKIRECGSRDGGVTHTDPGPVNYYGRSVEIFSASTDAANQPQYVVVRWNDLSYSYNWGGPSANTTEGVGIGFDDYTLDCTAYGNVCAFNEGNGAAPWNNKRSRVFGNVFIDNMKLPEGNRGNTLFNLQADVYCGIAEDVLLFGNAIVSGRNQAQLFGLATRGVAGFASPRGRYHNNLFVNAKSAAIAQDAEAGTAATFDYNFFRNNAANKINEQGGAPIALTANEGFSTSGATTDPIVQATEISETLFRVLPIAGVAAPAPAADFGELHGGANGSNTGPQTVSVSLPAAVDAGQSLHLIGLIWSFTQQQNKITGLPTTSGETWAQSVVSEPYGDMEVYIWRVNQVQQPGANKTASITITAGGATVYSFYLFAGPPIAGDPVDVTARGSQSGLEFTLSGGANTSQPVYVVAGISHNDFNQNRAVTITGDSGWTLIDSRIDSNPAPSNLVYKRELAANSPLQIVTTATVAPLSWWHGAAVAYKTGTAIAPNITTTSLPAGTVGVDYQAQIVATGTAPIFYSRIGGAFPPGLSLRPATGILEGIPTAAGTFNPVIEAFNSSGAVTRTLQIVVSAVPARPSLFTATALSSSSIRVNWTPADSLATSFEIRRKLAANGTVVDVFTAAAGDTSRTYTGLPASTAQFFDIRAVNNVGASPYTAEATATTLAAAVLYAQILVASQDRYGADIAGSGNWTVAIWRAPVFPNIVGELLLQTTGQAFEPNLIAGEARMRVPLGSVSSLVSAGTPLRVCLTDNARTTGIIAAAVAT